MKHLLIFSTLVVYSFSATCSRSEILGAFPEIKGVNCTDYALMIGFAAGLGAYIFWEQVTK